MKKIASLLFLTIGLTSCGWLNFNTSLNTSVSFSFTDTDEKDIFGDFLTVDDFYITVLKGAAIIEANYALKEKTVFEIFFGEDDDKKVDALFHLKDDIDTVSVSFRSDYYSLRNLYYNGKQYKMEKKNHNYLTIKK